MQTYTRTKGNILEQVQLIVTTCPPLRAILIGFYTTAVVNIIAWNKAYSIFPLSTFVQHLTYLLRPLDARIGNLVQKYRGRGWELGDPPWLEDEDETNNSIREERFIRDRFSWIIPFNNSGIDKPNVPDHVLECAIFAMDTCYYRPENLHVFEGVPEDHTDHHYIITSITFSACTLRYTYLFDTVDVLRWFGERMNLLTYFEMSKLPEDKRPQHWNEIWEDDPKFLYEWRHAFQGIETWTYFDDSMPRWIKLAKDQTNKIRRKFLALPWTAGILDNFLHYE